MPPTITRDYAMRSGDHLSQKFWGILKRKERWGFSWRGWLLLTSAGLVAAYFALLNIYPFLAVTHRVNTNVLVVEGTNDYNTSASVAAESLEKFVVPDDLVQMVPSRVFARERTYSSAVALRDWFREHNTPVHSINVLTEGPHARRTRLLYQKAFGKNMAVGVIAVSNPDYNPKDWWRYSDGVREVIGESIAYIYARFFFYPSVSSSDKEMAQAAPASR